MTTRSLKLNSSEVFLIEANMQCEGNSIFCSSDFHDDVGATTVDMGRGTVHPFRYGGKNMVFKHYSRGGLLSKIVDDKYIWLTLEQTRSFAEFRALSKIHGLSLPVPKPVAARATRRLGLYTADLITEKIENAKTLGNYLDNRFLTKKVSSAVGKTIKKFHEKAIYHPDLNVENIMIDDDENVFLLDFDKFKVQKLNKRTGLQNIHRLDRSMRKKSISNGQPFPQEQWEHIVESYEAPK